jgi:hypothetical protein
MEVVAAAATAAGVVEVIFGGGQARHTMATMTSTAAAAAATRGPMLRRRRGNAIGAFAIGSSAMVSGRNGAGATKDQLEEIVADESLGLIDHYRIVRGALYKGFGAASELGDGNSGVGLAATSAGPILPRPYNRGRARRHSPAIAR